MAERRGRISKRIGEFTGDRRVLLVLLLAAVMLGGRVWLAEHPQHNPWAPLDLNDPPGWATQGKLLALRDDPTMCRAVLQRSNVTFTTLEPAGEGACARSDRTRLDAYPLSPDRPATTCAVAVALTLWQRNSAEPLAQEMFEADLTEIEHLGAYSCRRLYGRSSGRWSQHATGNAIDIAAFVFDDGTRISVLDDWNDGTEKQEFLRRVRDGACATFATVLSPDYNEAHRDHFHFDMSPRWSGMCR